MTGRRKLTTPAGAASALAVVLTLCTPPPAGATSHADAQVERTGAGEYRLHWSGMGEGVPVDVFVAAHPDAPASARRLVVDDDRDGEATIHLESRDRRYFFLAREGSEGSEGSKGLWVAERVLPLQGGRNFRDLGGYRTSDGRHVRWGKVYRSGTMSELTDADYEYLSHLGIRVICDFRTTSERQAQPNLWQRAAGIDYWARDYAASVGRLDALVSMPSPTPADATAAIAAGYRELPFEQAEAFRVMFGRLVAGETPLAFNCTAGKDRTGVAAALILTALGVPRETVIADYALSDRIVAASTTQAGNAKLRESYPFLAKLPPDVLAPLFRADPAYIEAMFAAVEQRHGSVAGYLRDVLGVSDHDIEVLHAQLLE